MSINDMVLPPDTLYDLYKNVLVDDAAKNHTSANKKANGFSILGNNSRQITILVSSAEFIHLPDAELNFLMGVLAACKLSMDNVAILNIDKNNSVTYQGIAAELKANSVLLFGITPAQIELPLQFPNYQIQKYNNQVYLSAPPLSTIQNDKAEKMKLWNCLKQIFPI